MQENMENLNPETQNLNESENQNEPENQNPETQNPEIKIIKKEEKKKNIYRQTELILGSSKIVKYLGEIGINKNLENQLESIKDKLDLVKKLGKDKPPTYGKEPPKRISPKEKNQNVIDDYKNKHKIYKEEKSVYDLSDKEYKLFVSDKYKKSFLGYKLLKKLKEVNSLQVKLNETEDEKKKENLSKLIDDLKNNILTFKKKNWNAGFEEVLVVNFDKINDQITSLENNYRETNVLFQEKEALESKKTRFSEQLRIAVICFIQETIKDIANQAVKSMGKKKTLLLDAFKDLSSPYCVFYKDVKSYLDLQEYFRNKEKFAETERKVKEICKESGITNGFKFSFAKNLASENTDFGNFVEKIINSIKKQKAKNGKIAKRKFSVNSEVKNYLAGLTFGYLNKLSKQIDIIVNKKNKSVKTFDLQSFIMLVKLEMINSNEKEVSELINKIKAKVEEFKNTKQANNFSKRVAAEIKVEN